LTICSRTPTATAPSFWRHKKTLVGITFHEPYRYLDYNKAKCVISDSGTISEESRVAGFNAVSLRDSIERPKALESGSIILTGVDPATLLQAIEIELTLRRATVTNEGYESFESSSRVLKSLMSTARKHKNWKRLRS
jgi:UDP-N-acetylglucosamine 2-epimerase (non-hydrolysing)